MKAVLLIGLGRFGRHIALQLNEMNHQVMAVDQDEERVNAALPFVTNAQIGDSTSEEFLSSIGVRNFDICIVAIGDNFQSSLETTSLLKELGAKRVVARASRDVQRKFLLKWCIRKSRWRYGPLSDTARITLQTISRWVMATPSLKLRCRQDGQEKQSGNWM